MTTLKRFPQQIVTTAAGLSQGMLDLKSLAIFYDRIVIIDDDVFRTDVRAAVGREFDFLERKGVIEIRSVKPRYASGLPDDYQSLCDEAYAPLAQSIFASEGSPVKAELIQTGQNGLVRLEAVRSSLAEPDITFVPHIWGATPMSSQPIARPGDQRIPATEILFHRVPVPEEGTPWEAILEFRNEEASKLGASNLHLWMRGKFSDTNFPHFERDVELELNKLAAKLELHDAKVRHTRIKIFAGIVDIVSSFIPTPFKPTGAERIVGVRKDYIDVREMELNMRFEPLYFLQEAKRRFASEG